MTSTQKPDANQAASKAPELAAGDFANDVGPRNLSDSFRNYIQRVRGGEVGALPAVVGVVILAIIFNGANNLFLSKGNFANFLTQAAPVAILAMGTVFVLLLGEIDLSLGTATGVCAGTMALGLNKSGDLRLALGTGVYVVFVLFLVGTIVIGAFYRLWLPTVIVTVGVVLILTGLTSNQLAAMYVSVAVGVSIGLLIGFLVAHVGIPSFVVTLALYLAWQGVLLQFIGTGAAIPTRGFSIINGLENRFIPPVWGWVIWAVAIVAYGAYTIVRSIRRKAAKLNGEPLDLVLLRLVALGLATGLVVYLLNQNRSKSVFGQLIGMPYVLPLIVVLLVLWTIVLTKSKYGRYIYATGGNAEAARRAGIDTRRIRLSVFVISSGMAGIAAIVSASRLGGVPSDFGTGTTQLYAVAAAVIGGASLFGGRGKVRDGLIGALVIAMIPNGLGLLGLGTNVEFMVTALVLLLAASVDAISRRKTAAR